MRAHKIAPPAPASPVVTGPWQGSGLREPIGHAAHRMYIDALGVALAEYDQRKLSGESGRNPMFYAEMCGLLSEAARAVVES